MKGILVALTICAMVITGCDRQDSRDEIATSEFMSELQRKSEAGVALWEERCRTTAGERIYRSVDGVQGVVLFGVRGNSHRDLADPMWPGAAFAKELGDEYYIETFLGYEHSGSREVPVSSERRGYINLSYDENNLSNLPGYQYVDVVETKLGERYRYTRSREIVSQKDLQAPDIKREFMENPDFDVNVYRWVLRAEPAPEEIPRYGIIIEDQVIPEERAVGVASSIVRVVDNEAKEVLGELVRYAWAAPRSSANPTPWLRARTCPGVSGTSYGMTRKFVDKVLIPYSRGTENGE